MVKTKTLRRRGPTRRFAHAFGRRFTADSISDLGQWMRAGENMRTDGSRQFTAANSEAATNASNDLDIGTNDFSFSVFVYPDTLGAGAQTVYSDGGAGGGNGVWLYISNVNVNLAIQVGGTSTTYTWVVSLDATAWSHLAIAADRDGNATLWVNGVSQGTNDISARAGDASGSTHVLGRYFTSGDHFNGRLSMFGLWIGKQLTAAEVAYLFNSKRGRVYGELGAGGTAGSDLLTSLVPYLNMNEASGDIRNAGSGGDFTDVNTVTAADGPGIEIAGDDSGNDHAGVLTNMTPATAWGVDTPHGSFNPTVFDKSGNNNHLRLTGADFGVVHDTNAHQHSGTMTNFSDDFAAHDFDDLPDALKGSGRASIQFDSADSTFIDYTDKTAFDPGTSDFEYTIWMKRNGIPASTESLISRADTTGANERVALYLDSSGLAHGLFDDGPSAAVEAVSTTNVCDGNWHKIRVAHDRDGDITIEIDDVEEDTGDISGSSAVDLTPNFKLIVGAYNDGTSLFYDGKLAGFSLTINGVVIVASDFRLPRSPLLPVGATGQSLSFDGVDDGALSSSDPLSGKTALTAAGFFYINTENLDGTFLWLLDGGSNGNTSANNGFYLVADDRGGGGNATQGLKVGVATDVTTQRIEVFDNVIQSTGWYHLAMTYDSTSLLTVYINGHAQTADTVADAGTGDFTPSTIASSSLSIASDMQQAGFDAICADEIRIYDRALTSAEIMYLYTSHIGTANGDDPGTGDLMLHADFEEDNLRRWWGSYPGASLDMDGTDDYVDAGNVASGIKTIELWLYPHDITTRKIIDLDGTDQIELDGSGNVTATSFPAATVYVDGVQYAGPLTANTWHHVVVTDSTGVNASAVDIGRAGASNEFDGLFYMTRLLTAELTAAQVKQHYENSTIQTAEADWQFNGPARSLVDQDTALAWESKTSERSLYRMATAANRPLLRTGANGINGRDAVQFSASDLLTLVNTTSRIYQTFTIAMVVKIDSSVDLSAAAVVPVTLGGDGNVVAKFTGFEAGVNAGGGTGRIDMFAGSGNDRTATLAGIATKNTGLLWLGSVPSDGAIHSATVRGNRTATTLGTAGADQTMAVKLFGANSHIGGDILGANSFIGLVAEILIYKRVLTTVEQNKLEQYLGSRYAISG